MAKIPAFIDGLFRRKSQVLSHKWIPNSHVLDASYNSIEPQGGFVPGDDYVVLRLAEMYLRNARIMWTELYPVVHSFVAYGDTATQRTIATVAGPGQLRDLGNSNLDRLIGLAYRLAGPLVYDGQDIDVLAGLYAVPAADGSKVLIGALSQLSGLVPVLKQATEVANIVKAGTEGLLGLSDTELVVGIRNTLRLSDIGVGWPAKPGFMVAVNAPEDSVPEAQLWVREGRLYEGPTPRAARPFDSYDMMLFELHRGPSRAPVFATIPVLASYVKSFDSTLRDSPTGDLPGTVNELFRKFEIELRGVEELTRPDKSAVREIVADELIKRVKAIRDNVLIETRSISGAQVKFDARSFSARTIPEFVPEMLLGRKEGLPLFSG